MNSLKGREVSSLIRRSVDMMDKTRGIMDSGEFMVTGKYALSGYDIQEIHNLCVKLCDIVSNSEYTMTCDAV